MKILHLKTVSGFTYMLDSVCYRALLNIAQEDEGLIELILKTSKEITLLMEDFNFAAIYWELNEASGNE